MERCIEVAGRQVSADRLYDIGYCVLQKEVFVMPYLFTTGKRQHGVELYCRYETKKQRFGANYYVSRLRGNLYEALGIDVDAKISDRHEDGGERKGLAWYRLANIRTADVYPLIEAGIMEYARCQALRYRPYERTQTD